MKQKAGNRFVLDTSALLTLHYDEKGAEAVETMLKDARNGRAHLFVSFISRMEMFYVIWKEHGREKGVESLRLLGYLPVKIVESNEEILLEAAKLKATKPLSLADSWVAATSIHMRATLVHKNPEFESIEDLVNMARLPYK